MNLINLIRKPKNNLKSILSKMKNDSKLYFFSSALISLTIIFISYYYTQGLFFYSPLEFITLGEASKFESTGSLSSFSLIFNLPYQFVILFVNYFTHSLFKSAEIVNLICNFLIYFIALNTLFKIIKHRFFLFTIIFLSTPFFLSYIHYLWAESFYALLLVSISYVSLNLPTLSRLNKFLFFILLYFIGMSKISSMIIPIFFCIFFIFFRIKEKKLIFSRLFLLALVPTILSAISWICLLYLTGKFGYSEVIKASPAYSHFADAIYDQIVTLGGYFSVPIPLDAYFSSSLANLNLNKGSLLISIYLGTVFFLTLVFFGFKKTSQKYYFYNFLRILIISFLLGYFFGGLFTRSDLFHFRYFYPISFVFMTYLLICAEDFNNRAIEIKKNFYLIIFLIILSINFIQIYKMHIKKINYFDAFSPIVLNFATENVPHNVKILTNRAGEQLLVTRPDLKVQVIPFSDSSNGNFQDAIGVFTFKSKKEIESYLEREKISLIILFYGNGTKELGQEYGDSMRSFVSSLPNGWGSKHFRDGQYIFKFY
jgi:hypothetical protein